ncbi:zinc finger protein 704-like [Anopheles cruzii]|uniref:zinc finger protein 704-like n=1 Tax=Anopheles cruzii TaxID=68878 RepID=UPI0022EC37A9|nr:zinc finger protein 704-like [Anopheles cruzii]
MRERRKLHTQKAPTGANGAAVSWAATWQKPGVEKSRFLKKKFKKSQREAVVEKMKVRLPAENVLEETLCAPVELTKRLEEVRLLESRRSLRLAVQEKDTDFARLADMAGGDRRRQSNSIDVPFTLTQQNGSRKRRPSYSQDDREYYSINDDDPMDECNAALVLMSLSCSPNSGSSVHGYETILGTSSGSSTTSWSTGSTSPPLSEDGHSTPPTHHHHELSHHHHYHHSHHGRASHQGGGGGGGGGGATGGEVVRGARTTSLSTSDEGIGMEYNEDMPRKRRASQRIFKCTWKGCGVIYTTCSEITAHVRNAHLGPRKPNEYSDEEEFFFTDTEDESDGSAPNPPSPPTLSHRDMARPPHEDPEYQRQIVGNYRQGLLSQSQALQAQQQAAQQQQQQQHQTQQQQQVAAIKPPLPAGLTVAALSGTSNGTTNGGATSNGGGTNGSSSSSNGSSVSPLMHHNYITTWSQISPTSPQKHVRLSPRPPASYPYPSPNYQHHYQAQVAQQQQQQQQHHQQQLGHIQLSPGSGTGGSAGNGSTAAYQQLLAGAGAAGLSLGSYSGSGSGSGVTGSAAAAAAAAGGPQHRSPVSPNRRTRGENKKCRKVYGMDHKDQWCTQCKWKKACSRFGD